MKNKLQHATYKQLSLMNFVLMMPDKFEDFIIWQSDEIDDFDIGMKELWLVNYPDEVNLYKALTVHASKPETTGQKIHFEEFYLQKAFYLHGKACEDETQFHYRVKTILQSIRETGRNFLTWPYSKEGNEWRNLSLSDFRNRQNVFRLYQPPGKIRSVTWDWKDGIDI